MGFIKSIAGLLGANRSWLTLLLLGGVAAWLWWEFSTVRAERNRFRAWSDIICASAGSSFAPAPNSELKPGQQCQAEIAALAKFRTDQARLSADTLATAAIDRDTKMARDLASAARDARTAAEAAADMESQNADVKADHVDADWFDTFNRLAGLRQKAN